MPRPTLLATVSALLLVGTATGPPLAQELPGVYPSCMLTEELASFLREQFEEMPMARGVSDDGVLVTMFAAKAAGTWTIALTDPSGVSCILAAGTGFELMPEALARQSNPLLRKAPPGLRQPGAVARDLTEPRKSPQKLS